MLGAIEMEVGVDCVEISRFSKQNASFFKKVFTDEEIEYCNNKGKPLQHFAVKFAGKEAVLKAMYSFGIPLDVSKIEILNSPSGSPYVKMEQPLLDKHNIKISLSHSETLAIAMAVVLRKNG